MLYVKHNSVLRGFSEVACSRRITVLINLLDRQVFQGCLPSAADFCFVVHY